MSGHEFETAESAFVDTTPPVLTILEDLLYENPDVSGVYTCRSDHTGQVLTRVFSYLKADSATASWPLIETQVAICHYIPRQSGTETYGVRVVRLPYRASTRTPAHTAIYFMKCLAGDKLQTAVQTIDGVRVNRDRPMVPGDFTQMSAAFDGIYALQEAERQDERRVRMVRQNLLTERALRLGDSILRTLVDGGEFDVEY